VSRWDKFEAFTEEIRGNLLVTEGGAKISPKNPPSKGACKTKKKQSYSQLLKWLVQLRNPGVTVAEILIVCKIVTNAKFEGANRRSQVTNTLI
jgi:hypothetical protein